MESKIQTFDTACGVLQKGVNLVEASAGTGKTYAIAMVVLRAIVELDISIDKILIVTFTRAATEELRSRIRARLVEGRDTLQESLQNPDPTLAAWAAALIDKKTALRRLQLALYEIDRAGIFTIHGFCQRMLVDHPLESGQLFDVELLADIDPIRSEIVDDFWRSHIYPLDSMACSIVLQEFENPEELLNSIRGTGKGAGRIEPVVGEVESVLASLKNGFTMMSEWWTKNGSQLIGQLGKIKAENGFKKGFSDSFERWSRSLDEFFGGIVEMIPADLQLLKSGDLVKELNGKKYRGDAKKKHVLASCILPGNEIDLFLDSRDELLLTFRVQLAMELQEEVEKRLNRRGSLSYDDLITRLSRGLRGEWGHDLRRMIRNRFTVALIDEFQDTDSSQWYIFSELFSATTHYLYLIGDPKQAIYKFRGADIYSYFHARSSADHYLTLDKNYRSHPYLVDEVNSLFTSRPNPFYLEEERIDYHPVKPARTGEDIDLLRDGNSLAGMVYCLLPGHDEDGKEKRWTSGKAAGEFRRFVATEIIRLLDPHKPVILRMGKERALRPRDIAVLVRTNRQASEYLEELRGMGVPAVISTRESVFQSEECKELSFLLQAVVQPGDLSLLKRAMTIRWFGFNGDDLVDLWRDEEHFNLWHERFLIYNSLWQTDGLMVMMGRLIVDENVYPTLSSQQGTERSITNIQHLLELVQEAENTEHFQTSQTLLWLRRMMETDVGKESGELRLESDEEAIQIITMHGAKGLEYPVVFCPYLWYRSNRLKNEKYCITGHDKENNPIIDLGSHLFEANREKGIAEEMGEEMRLLYVALTRAGIRCYAMWGDVKGRGNVEDSFDSALGYMLFPGGLCSAREQSEKLQELAVFPSGHLASLETDDICPSYHWQSSETDLHPKLPTDRKLYSDWQMSSYSAMTSLTEYDDELLPDRKEHQNEATIPVIRLPAGPNFGNVVHEVLESIPFSHLATPGNHETILAAACRKYGVNVASEPLFRLLKNVVTTPLPIPSGRGSFTLASLPETSCLKEMEFYFRMSRVETEMINHILAPEPAVCRLSHRVMQGYLTGLIDLICEYDGRYYILDYKTNYLGDGMEGYREDNLCKGMRSHNYGLQFWIYTLVLHCHLKNVIADYSYKDHFGGVFYLFVRGMKDDLIGNGVFSTVPDIERLIELDRIFGGADGE